MILNIFLDNKRARFDEGALSVLNDQPRNNRTSQLMAPIMLLIGHDGEIFCAKFSIDGKCLATAGFDMKICKFFIIFLELWIFPKFKLEFLVLAIFNVSIMSKKRN